jgi:uncharacterized protein YdhG (YjbR/CyaY superfamily)
MTSKAKTVPAYLKSLPADRRKALAAIRALARRTRPRLIEGMTYGMPTYFVGGQPVFAFASQAHYMSLYLCDPVVMREIKPRLGKLSCGKGCVRFRKLDDLPLDVAGAMLRMAARRTASGEFNYAAMKKKRTA